MIVDSVTSLSGLNKFRVEQLDAAMVELTGKPFLPSMSMAARRRTLWREVQKQRALGQATKPEVKANHPIFVSGPKASPKAIPYTAVAERTVFAAAQVGISYPDLLNVVDAHFRGFGERVDVPREAQKVLARINVIYGWGVRTYPNGTVEVYS